MTGVEVGIDRAATSAGWQTAHSFLVAGVIRSILAGAVWTEDRWHRSAPKTHTSATCPHCANGVPETLQHMRWECPAWDDIRRDHPDAVAARRTSWPCCLSNCGIMPVGLYPTPSEQTAGLHQAGPLRARAALSSGNYSRDCHEVYFFLRSTTSGLPVGLEPSGHLRSFRGGPARPTSSTHDVRRLQAAALHRLVFLPPLFGVASAGSHGGIAGHFQRHLRGAGDRLRVVLGVGPARHQAQSTRHGGPSCGPRASLLLHARPGDEIRRPSGSSSAG